MQLDAAQGRSRAAKSAATDGVWRRLRFAFLERTVLPPGMWLLRRWLQTCQCTVDGLADLQSGLAADQTVVAVLHGSMLHLLALSLTLRGAQRRRFFVLLSASLDGHLLAAALQRFGIDHAVGASGEDGERGGRQVIRKLRDRQVAVIAVDGPTGPRGVAKPGLGRLVQMADAHLLVVRTTARGLRLPSWDRCHVPWPFTRIHFTIHHLPSPQATQTPHLVRQIEAMLAGTGDARHAGGALGSMPSSADAPRTTVRDGAR